MNVIFIRIFHNDYYFEYVLEEGKKQSITINNKDYYVMYVNNKVVSNFICSDFKFNNIYQEPCFSYMLGVYGQTFHIKSRHFNINEIIYNSCDVEVNLTNNYIKFTSPIYIEKKLYQNGKFYFNNTLVFCALGYKFKIEEGVLSFNQKGNYRNYKYFQYALTTSEKYYLKSSFRYSFSYNKRFKDFHESLSRYIIPPLIMLGAMVFIAIFTKRINMIIFMGASSVSTVSASLIMYFKQKNKIKIFNDYVLQGFEVKVKKLCEKVTQDLKYNYKTNNFKLITLPNHFGYILKPCEIEIDISEESLCDKFKLYKSKLGNYHYPVSFKSIAIIGKYAAVYLDNLLITLMKSNYNKHVIFIGKFIDYKFIKHRTYYKNIGEIPNYNFKNCIIIINIEFDLGLLAEENQIININIENGCKNILGINSVFRNKLIKFDNEYCNIDFLVALETNYQKLFIASQKIIFDNSNINIKTSKGLRISEDYFLDIERFGPHGLIVGMTGSGKSVLLLQLILQICSNYSPSEAVISIIDFKGDSLISRVKDLPHISSTFSNLNGGYENIIASINYEMQYRQQVFSKYNVSEFEQLKKGILPRLFLIIDEFAELSKKSATISEEIESIARVGRSLGIFLIISLQKSSGIVTQQLKSNINYKICLKVNSVEDSMDVIGENYAAYFTTAGEAIVAINNHTEHLVVENCLDVYKEDIIINNRQKSNISRIDYQIREMKAKYQTSNYVVWKNFPLNKKSKVLLNVINSKEFYTYQFRYGNYIVIGKSGSGKSSLVKNIIKDYNCCIFYLGIDQSFVSCVDMYIDNVMQISVFISYMKFINYNVVFIVDGIELFSSNILHDFIEECSYNTYQNIKVILVCQSVTSSITRMMKLFDHKFMLSVNDPSEYYSLFYKNYSKISFSVGEGVCIYNDQLVEFKSYQTQLRTTLKKYSFNSSSNFISMHNFKEVDVSDAICIYDEFEPEFNLFYQTFYYKSVDETILRKYYDKTIFTNTDKFEYRFRKCNVISGMLYDVVNDCAIINTKNLKFK